MYKNKEALVVVAAGNSGPGFVTSPAISKNALTVGSVSASGTTVSPFSAGGNQPDGRMKPDLLAIGDSVLSASSKVTEGITLDRKLLSHCDITQKSGTSVSAALVTAAAAQGCPIQGGEEWISGVDSFLLHRELACATYVVRSDMHNTFYYIYYIIFCIFILLLNFALLQLTDLLRNCCDFLPPRGVGFIVLYACCFFFLQYVNISKKDTIPAARRVTKKMEQSSLTIYGVRRSKPF